MKPVVSGPGDGPDHEIDVTPEMIEAGAVALLTGGDDELRALGYIQASLIAECVLRAALGASSRVEGGEA